MAIKYDMLKSRGEVVPEPVEKTPLNANGMECLDEMTVRHRVKGLFDIKKHCSSLSVLGEQGVPGVGNG